MPRASPPPEWTSCSSTTAGSASPAGHPGSWYPCAASAGTITLPLAAARRLPGVDPDRIVLWGVSYAGGHVVVVAAQDKRVAAAISLTPAMDGIAILIQLGRNGGPAHLVRAAGNGLRDALRALAGRAPRLVPIVGEPGSNAIIVKAGGEAAFNAIAGPSWRNELCARTALEAGFNRPIRSASRVSCPLLVQVGTSDSICPPSAGRRAVAKAGPRAALREYPVDHMDVYVGAWQERALADQLDFLRRARPASVTVGERRNGHA